MKPIDVYPQVMSSEFDLKLFQVVPSIIWRVIEKKALGSCYSYPTMKIIGESNFNFNQTWIVYRDLPIELFDQQFYRN